MEKNQKRGDFKDWLLIFLSIILTLFFFDIYKGFQIFGDFNGLGLHFGTQKFSSLCNSIEVNGLFKALIWYMAGWIISIPFIIGASICVYYFLNCILLRRSFEIGVSNTKKTNQAAILFFFLIITPQIYQFTVIKYIEPIYYQGDTYCEQLLNWEELMDKEDKIQNQN